MTTSHSERVRESPRRVDAVDKVTGRAAFTADLNIAGMLEGRVLRSPYPHASILDIRTDAAERVPGVVAVLTGRDLKGTDPFYGHAVMDRPILAIDKVRFVGEPVAAVAAVDAASAMEAIEMIEVDYEDLPQATTLEEALAEDAPHLHDTDNLRLGAFHGLGNFHPEGNICYRHAFSKGKAKELIEAADIVIEADYSFPAVYQYAMEPHASVVRWDEDGATVWSSCQHPYLVRAELAELFNLPTSQVRVIVPYLGGGFGSKSYTRMEPLTMALARKAGRPVRIVNRIDESMVTSRRHNMHCWMRTAADSEGKLLARQVRMWMDTGAYADNGPRVVATAADAAPGPYQWQAYDVEAFGVYTNRPPSGSYRAFGATHLQWIGESQIDEIARKTGLDAVEIRLRNLLPPGGEVRPGGKPLDADLAGDVRQLASALGWNSPKPPGVGRGISVGLLAAGAHPVSSAILRLEADGSATLLVSTTELGQGARTVFSQLVAQELGLSIEHIRVPGADTQSSPYDRSTGASRSTTLAGTAVLLAAQDVRTQVLEKSAAILKAAPDELILRDGAVWNGAQSLPYPELFIRHFSLSGGEIIGKGVVEPEAGKGSYAAGPVFWEVCVGGAEVSIDEDTGKVHIHKLVTVADVGQAINPTLVEAQEMGGSTQGLGNALFEEMIFNDGQIMNSTLLDYHIPTVKDLPEHFGSVIVENEDGPGPFGSKGVGEGSLAGATAAIYTAVRDTGLEIRTLPLTPERVWRALKANNSEVSEAQSEIGSG